MFLWRLLLCCRELWWIWWSFFVAQIDGHYWTGGCKRGCSDCSFLVCSCRRSTLAYPFWSCVIETRTGTDWHQSWSRKWGKSGVSVGCWNRCRRCSWKTSAATSSWRVVEGCKERRSTRQQSAYEWRLVWRGAPFVISDWSGCLECLSAATWLLKARSCWRHPLRPEQSKRECYVYILYKNTIRLVYSKDK